jgi:hypothetical protein
VGGLELARVEGLHLFHHHTVIILHERAHMQGSECLVSRVILCVLPFGGGMILWDFGHIMIEQNRKEMGWAGRGGG